MSTEMAVELVEVEKKIEAEMMPLITRAQAFVVRDEQTYLDADIIASEVKAKIEERKIELLPGKELATKTWKYHVALCKKYIDDPLEVIKILDRKRYAWKKAEDAKRAAQAEEIRQEAIRLQEEERRKEAARIAAEAKAKADEALATAERLRAANMAEQADAVMEAAGKEEVVGMAQAVSTLNAPLAAVVVPEPAKVVKPEGQTNVENWQFKIVNADLIPREYLTPDTVKIGKAVKLMKGMTSIQGVEVIDIGSVRRKA